MSKSKKYIACALIIVCSSIIALISVNRHNSVAIVDLEKPCDLNKFVGIKVVIHGKAENAKEGAILMGAYGMVIVEAMDEWVGVEYDARTSIQGILAKKEWPKSNENDEYITASQVGVSFYITPDP